MLKGVLLAAGMLVVLAGSSVADEECPAPLPPVTIGGDAGHWTVCFGPPIGLAGMMSIVLALAMVGYFIAGLLRHRHDWKPLVLGLFALGLGVLDALVGTKLVCATGARMCGTMNPSDFCQGVYVALLPTITGLIIALTGGACTAILLHRNRRHEQADMKVEADAGWVLTTIRVLIFVPSCALLLLIAMAVVDGLIRALKEWADPSVQAPGALCTGYRESPGTLFVLSVLFLLAMLCYFIVDVVRRRYTWMPLLLGLFSFGLGLLDALMEIRRDCGIIASKHGTANPADLLYGLSTAHDPVIIGLIAAAAGGLFTVILRWRSERLRAEEAAEAEDGVEETEKA